MLCLRAYRVLRTPDKKKFRIQKYTVIHKWNNEEIVDFKFDIFNPEAWRKFLRTFRTKNNKKLPRFTDNKEPIVYQVYFWGIPKYVKEHFNTEGVNSGYQCLFPGVDEKTGKQYNCIEYGWLDE